MSANYVPRRMVSCGPYVCDYPDAGKFRWHERWHCPRCGTSYIRRADLSRYFGWLTLLLFSYETVGKFWGLTLWQEIRHDYADAVFADVETL